MPDGISVYLELTFGNQEALEGKIVLQDDDPHIVGMMMSYLYRLDYDVSIQNEADCQDMPTPLAAHEYEDPSDLEGGDQSSLQIRSELLLHAQVYVVADKYMIGGLKDLALRKFKAATRQGWVVEDLVAAAQLAYSDTTEADRGLREAVTATIYEHPDVLDKEEIRNVLRDTGALGLDLIMLLRRESRF